MVTLTIKGKLDGLNQYTQACRSKNVIGNTVKKRNEKLITVAIKEQIPDIKLEKTAELHFRWYEGNKRRDLDNICFAKKFILDALVKNKVIKTDSWQGVKGFTDQFFIDKDNPRIEVDIEEVCDE